ncbi:MAG: mRNA splicing protein prp18 [Phylliscum demangeonii]|nr:MAG: mRNA splicing protein prp18 [Phylliscum demangeonii]
MDFAALMSKEIAKAPIPSATTPSTSTSYLKRAEQEQQREAAYLAEQQALHAAKAAKASTKRRREEEEAERIRVRDEKRARLAEESKKRRLADEARAEAARRKRLGLPEQPPPPTAEALSTRDGDGDGGGAKAGLVAKLRQMGEPARLFGETHKQRVRRYGRLTTTAAAGSATGYTSMGLLPEEEMKVGRVIPKDEAGKKHLYRQLASYFTMVLKEWEAALEARSAEVKDSFQGKAASAAFLQSRENMKPLFRKFEKGELDILDAVVEIVNAVQERRYVHANDAYLRLSIGKAAWPIGVTMVGIHERSAREKLHESEAHIMSDEVTRKFLQSIKRCISFVQTRWPPFDQGQLMG